MKAETLNRILSSVFIRDVEWGDTECFSSKTMEDRQIHMSQSVCCAHS